MTCTRCNKLIDAAAYPTGCPQIPENVLCQQCANLVSDVLVAVASRFRGSVPDVVRMAREQLPGFKDWLPTLAEDRLRIPEDRLRVRACRQAARDHVDQRREAVATPLSAAECEVKAIRYFDRVYSADVGEVEVRYAREGWRALYGFTADGELTLYAD